MVTVIYYTPYLQDKASWSGDGISQALFNSLSFYVHICPTLPLFWNQSGYLCGTVSDSHLEDIYFEYSTW